jgi:hypothetical protein
VSFKSAAHSPSDDAAIVNEGPSPLLPLSTTNGSLEGTKVLRQYDTSFTVSNCAQAFPGHFRIAAVTKLNKLVIKTTRVVMDRWAIIVPKTLNECGLKSVR